MAFSFKNDMSLIILILTIIIQVKPQCYNYDQGDTYPDLNTSYCAKIIKWPVSDQTFANFAERDAWALGNYTSLYQNYYQQGLVTLDCLGMAKYFLCAMTYPTCTDDTPEITGMCYWMCDLFSIRCGISNPFYQSACVNSPTPNDTCSFDYRLLPGYLFVIVMVLLLS